MFSIYGDCVLDPFLGTGTTALAAALTGRNAVGYEVDSAFRPAVEKRLHCAPSLSHALNHERLQAHRTFLRKREKSCTYESEHYGFGVVTKQERKMRLYDSTEVEQPSENRFTFSYAPRLCNAGASPSPPSTKKERSLKDNERPEVVAHKETAGQSSSSSGST